MLFFLMLPGVAFAQTLSPPLVDVPSTSLAPDTPTLPSLPPAASNLLAPTSGNEAPPDALGANLQSTSSSPFVSAFAGDHPASVIDTEIRGTPLFGSGSPGSLSRRSLYTPTEAVRWAGSSPTATMGGVQPSGVHDSISSSSWGLAPANTPGAPIAPKAIPRVSAGARGTLGVGAPGHHLVHHSGQISSSTQSDGTSPFAFAPGNPETESKFGLSPFEMVGNQQDLFLKPDLTAVMRPRRIYRSQPAINLPTREVDRLKAELHPPRPSSNYGRRNAHTRTTMKSLIERDSQPGADPSALPPIFFIPQ